MGAINADKIAWTNFTEYVQVDDDDLSLALIVPERPADYLSDLSFVRVSHFHSRSPPAERMLTFPLQVKLVIARHSAMQTSSDGTDQDYAHLLETDKALQDETRVIELTKASSNPRRQPRTRPPVRPSGQCRSHLI